jgi:hypothetical protein
MKKYVLTKVINQITARRARPIYHDLQRSIFRTPQRKKNEILRMAGKSITGRCDKRKSEGRCVPRKRHEHVRKRTAVFCATSPVVLSALCGVRFFHLRADQTLEESPQLGKVRL